MNIVPCRSEPLFSNGAQSGGFDGVNERSVCSKAQFRGVGNIGNCSLVGNGSIKAGLLDSAFFTKAAVSRKMYGPTHVMDTPVPSLAINLLGLGFTSFGRYTYPGLICLLLLLV